MWLNAGWKQVDGSNWLSDLSTHTNTHTHTHTHTHTQTWHGAIRTLRHAISTPWGRAPGRSGRGSVMDGPLCHQSAGGTTISLNAWLSPESALIMCEHVNWGRGASPCHRTEAGSVQICPNPRLSSHCDCLSLHLVWGLDLSAPLRSRQLQTLRGEVRRIDPLWPHRGVQGRLSSGGRSGNLL